jgi:hypothetical protein
MPILWLFFSAFSSTVLILLMSAEFWGGTKLGSVNTIRFHVVSEICVTPEENKAQ